MTVFLDATGISRFPSTMINRLMRPMQIGMYKTRLDFENFVATLVDIKNLRQNGEKLAVRNAALTAENAVLKKFKEENTVLKSQLGFKTAKQSLIPASIIGVDPKFLNSQLLLDVGSRDQVRKGDIVVFQNILLGRISAVNDTSSTLTLLSDPDTKIPAITDAGVEGLLKGDFGNTVKLSKVPIDQNLRIGQMIFTSGQASFPKNLVLGKVGDIEKNPSEIFQQSQVVPLVAAKDLKIVFIIKSD